MGKGVIGAALIGVGVGPRKSDRTDLRVRSA